MTLTITQFWSLSKIGIGSLQLPIHRFFLSACSGFPELCNHCCYCTLHTTYRKKNHYYFMQSCLQMDNK